MGACRASGETMKATKWSLYRRRRGTRCMWRRVRQEAWLTKAGVLRANASLLERAATEGSYEYAVRPATHPMRYYFPNMISPKDRVYRWRKQRKAEAQ